MLPPAIAAQIRRLHWYAKRAADDLLTGSYRSAFPGAGLTFAEVREYQPGDDVRMIDWNVTARSQTAFIKRFTEDRARTIYLLVDLSGSLLAGSRLPLPRTVAAEVATLIALTAVGTGDSVGLVLATTQVELHVPPTHRPRHVWRILRDLLAFTPQQTGTNLAGALDYLERIQRRRAIVFVLSDFFAPRLAEPLQRLARRHEVIAVRVTDPRATTLPAVGLVRVRDAESGRVHWLDTAALQVPYAERAQQQWAELQAHLRGAQADWLEVSTAGGHLEAVLQFFRRRRQRPPLMCK
jgi:uncharacterized protein (DUF58 family)